MSKNPFVNCKSRKRRKMRVMLPKPQEKLFCPRTMVRYDNSPNDYGTVWVCKMCLKCVLSEEAVKQHLINCNAVSRKDKLKPAKKNEETRYICEFCDKMFSRRVTLKKHLEAHNKSSSGVDSEQSDHEVEDSSKTENETTKNDEDDKPEEGTSDNI